LARNSSSGERKEDEEDLEEVGGGRPVQPTAAAWEERGTSMLV
jgi:hypothetical protein